KLGQCSGIADLATKKWSLTGCKNNYSAHGTFTEGSGTEKYYGHGTDSKDVNVEIKILVPDKDNITATNETFEAYLESGVVTNSGGLKPKSADAAPVSKLKSSIQAKKTYSSARSLVMEWDGYPNILVGTIRYPKDRDGTFIAKFPSDGLTCAGSYSFGDKTTGVWNIACSNGEASTGTFITNPSGSTGTGVDTKGRKVKYTVRPKEPNLSTSSSPKSIEQRLQQLKQLIDRGLISEDEAKAKRKEILGGL
ncbi:MAG: SHOCT domain-containing protein, partial [Gammaproteobacteria bacterium]|nr:SHOCT domain-containing protein [Gammaproteobacteria bacterium]